jgi:hypothetical protein
MGSVGTGTVLVFGTPQHTVYLYRGVAGIHGFINRVIHKFFVLNKGFSRFFIIILC